jgi:hypothetical protein
VNFKSRRFDLELLFTHCYHCIVTTIMETLTGLALIALAGVVGYGVCTQDEYAARCQQLSTTVQSNVNGVLEPYEPWQVRTPVPACNRASALLQP